MYRRAFLRYSVTSVMLMPIALRCCRYLLKNDNVQPCACVSVVDLLVDGPIIFILFVTMQYAVESNTNRSGFSFKGTVIAYLLGGI